MGRTARIVAFAVIACGAAWGRPALAQRPARETPASAAAVIERLPRGYASLEPNDRTRRPAIAQIDALLATAARTGDARLAARAEAMLGALPPKAQTTQVLKARAFAAQHRHDFDGAVRWLDEAVRRDPRDGDARLSRAQIRIVQGKLDLARRDCATLALGIDTEAGTLCAAALATRRGDSTQAAHLLDGLLAQSPRGDMLRYMLVVRGEIASRANDPRADDYYRRALALGTDDVRTLAAYARHLRAHGRDADAASLLARAPQTDGLALQNALSAHRLHARDAGALIDAQGRRYALARSLGTQPELRDEAEYWLTLRGNPTHALALAESNFAVQRDVEDVDILVRSAHAAHRPDALAGLQRWASTQQVALPKGATR